MTEENRKPTPEEKAKAAAEAMAKARAAKEAKEAAAQAEASTPATESAPASKPVSEMTPEEKAAAKKAAAAEALAKAKAAKEAAEQGEEAGSDADAKAKAAAAAKAKAAAAAAAKAKAAREAAGQGGDEGGDDAKAKAAAAAKAKAAAAAAAKAKAAQASGEAGGEEETPKAPSKNQPYLDKYVARLTEAFGADVLEASYINELSKEVPTLVIQNERWHDVATFLKNDEQLAFDYLSDLHGVDYEDRLEVYYHFYSYKNQQSVAVKVKTGREQASVASVMDLWQGANWNERETFDLLGIHFPGHSDLRRILLPDDWVGYPLRKDYVQYDEEV
ncbi:NADH-quinone oxidoreductase subunit C [Brevibacillus invocatus]|uniref:NADH-quinone oxidoreductase subunit C n=1 Tax=Brevibacillus invocatus TaxID=173959 RepID=A0A3M8CJL3_9BACL|nr:NADH-quinone oxidoreductase subunit C [Brevibacillus invocatus]RNB75758.1 NADH-quinone oxidoreductase subunit C [Brevibacillus invocatus]